MQRHSKAGGSNGSRTLLGCPAPARARQSIRSAGEVHQPRRTHPRSPYETRPRRRPARASSPRWKPPLTASGCDCEVREDASHYYLFVNDQFAGRDTGSIVAPIEQMAEAIDQAIHFRERFGLVATCHTRDFAIPYGTAKQQSRGEGRPAPMTPCLRDTLDRFEDDTLDQALRHAVDTLKRCCR